MRGSASSPVLAPDLVILPENICNLDSRVYRATRDDAAPGASPPGVDKARRDNWETNVSQGRMGDEKLVALARWCRDVK